MSRIESRVLVDGEGEGDVLHLEKDLSFWGAIDPLTGRIIDRRHPQFDLSVNGRIIVMLRSVGSSSGSAILMETLYRNCGPAGIILGEPDQILTLGAVVAGEMGYGSIPVLQVAPSNLPLLHGTVRIEIGGFISGHSISC